MGRVLVIKFGAIGDVLMAIPAVERLHRAGNQVDWVCGHTVLPILRLYPWIEPILADDRAILAGSAFEKAKALFALWRTLAGRRYDLVASLYYDARYRLITLPLRTARNLRLSHTSRRHRILPGRHHSDEFTRILLELPDEVRPLFVAPVPPPHLPPIDLPATGRSRVVLVPGGARNMLAEATLRRWPLDQYVALTRRLLAHGCEVILVGGPDDTWLLPHFDGLRVTNLVGKLKLPETLAVMDVAEVVVTHDTGPLHLAGISGASIVALFGPTDPNCFLPRRAGVTAIWGGEWFACRPCYDGRSFAPCPANECMREIPVDSVLDLVLEAMAARREGNLGGSRILTLAALAPSQTLVPFGNG